MKEIAASRIDNGPGSKLHGALIEELKLNSNIRQTSLYSDADLLGSFDHFLMKQNSILGHTRGSHREQLEASERSRETVRMAWKRFSFAIIGGLAIVLPAAVLVMHTAPTKVIAVVSGCILTFSCSVALFSTASPENLLGATAAYSAALMVFMGSYSPT